MMQSVWLLVLLLLHQSSCQLEMFSETDEFCYDPKTIYFDCKKIVPTCEDPYPVLSASLKCQRGCFCRSSFVRNADGKCIDFKDCPIPVCGRNEVFYECAFCEYKCSNVYLNEPLICYCKPGCVCKDKYARTNDGTCVLAEQCPTDDVKCPKDMHFSSGGLQKTCAKSARTVAKKSAGCFCNDGLSFHNRQCIPDSQCPDSAEDIECKRVDSRSEYKICQPLTEWVCDGQFNLLWNGASNCKPGCYCKAEFYRTKLGKCASFEECQKWHVTYTTGEFIRN